MTVENEAPNAAEPIETIPTPATAAPSVEDSIRASIAEVSEGAASEDEPKADTQGDTPPETPATSEDKPADKTASGRDQKGRFLKSRQQQQKQQRADGAAPETAEAQEARKHLPPDRWPVESKQQFLKLPEVAQREVLDYWKGIESHTTKLWQDLNREKDDHAEVSKLLGFYRPRWGIKGITDAQAIAELCATQDNINTRPFEAIDLIMQKRGMSLDQFVKWKQGGGQPATGQQNNLPPEFSHLMKEWNEFKNGMQAQTQSAYQQQVQTAAAQVNSVRHETDNAGNYRYPELWNDDYLRRVQPFVEDLRKSQPGLPWSELYKRAIHTVRVLEGKPGTPSPQNPKLSRESEIARARSAAVSVRTRGAVSIPTQAKARPGESVEDTIRKTLAGIANHQ